MAYNLSRASLWNEGGKAALAIGIIPIIHSLTTHFLAGLNGNGAFMAAAIAFLNVFLWALKFFGCIFLVRFFMKKLVLKYPSADNRTTLNYGTIISLLSALIVAAYNLAHALTMSADEIRSMVNKVLGDNMAMLDLNTRNMLDKTIEAFPVYSFFTTLIYCFIFGYILSLFLAKDIPSRNPFEGNRTGANNSI